MDDTTPSSQSAEQPRISPKASRPPLSPLTSRDMRAQAGRQSVGFWSFLRTLFVGTAGLAVLAVVGTLAGSAWLTANQRAEAGKPQPWADPSFTTTAVTTGGLLARWMDADGNLDNGHSYIKGIYDLWKTRQASTWAALRAKPELQAALPQLWQSEFVGDLSKLQVSIQHQRDIEASERQRLLEEAHRKGIEAELSLAGKPREQTTSAATDRPR